MGAQTEEIMAQLGYSEADIKAAEERGDVRGSTSIFA